MRTKVISGGQTGVDRASLDTAAELGLLIGGWCPKGRKAEDGIIPLHYSLLETPSADYAQRTEWNVRDSTMTLVLFRLVDLDANADPAFIVAQMKLLQVEVCKVADLRESFRPGIIYSSARKYLSAYLPETLSD